MALNMRTKTRTWRYKLSMAILAQILKNVILFGDFNSRTSSLPDFVVADKFISQLQNDDLLYEERLEVLNSLHKNNFPLDRQSADRSTNVYGKQRTEFCQVKATTCLS